MHIPFSLYAQNQKSKARQSKKKRKEKENKASKDTDVLVQLCPIFQAKHLLSPSLVIHIHKLKNQNKLNKTICRSRADWSAW
jgi:hypothetical protein